MRVRLTITGLTFAFIVCGVATVANADTVHMKNGRLIQSSSVRVEGDRVFVRLFQGEVAFPLDEVEKIVEDAEVERSAARQAQAVSQPPPEGVPTAGATQDPIPEAGEGPAEEAGGDPPAADPTVADPEEEPPEPAPEETREYWQNRIRPLREQLAQMDQRLQNLRSRNGADVLAQIGRIETQRAPVQSQIESITREARRLNVPSGWLR